MDLEIHITDWVGKMRNVRNIMVRTVESSHAPNVEKWIVTIHADGP